jgi:ABC-type sugar transport system ATPase subunit
MEGKEIHINSPRDAMEAGIAYVPEDRRGEGLVLLNDVEFNIGLANVRNLVKGIHVKKSAWKELVQEYVSKFSIKITSPQQKAGRLSGGNQQKVVLGKWLAINPKVIILDEPTRGIDVGSKAEIYSIINDLAAEGAAIIIVSSDLPEIINMCDRTYVMSEGHVTGELSAEEFSQEKIMTFSTTTKAAKGTV